MPDIDLGLILATLVSLVLGLLLGFGITALYFKRKISAEQKQLEEDKAKSQDNANIYLNVNSGLNEESWRLNSRKYPPHKTRILFYHQLD